MNESNEEGIEDPRHDTANEDLVLQETYKETIVVKSKRSRSHGYMSNHNKTQLLQESFVQQQRELQGLKEQVELQAQQRRHISLPQLEHH